MNKNHHVNALQTDTTTGLLVALCHHLQLLIQGERKAFSNLKDEISELRGFLNIREQLEQFRIQVYDRFDEMARILHEQGVRLELKEEEEKELVQKKSRGSVVQMEKPVRERDIPSPVPAMNLRSRRKGEEDLSPVTVPTVVKKIVEKKKAKPSESKQQQPSSTQKSKRKSAKGKKDDIVSVQATPLTMKNMTIGNFQSSTSSGNSNSNIGTLSATAFPSKKRRKILLPPPEDDHPLKSIITTSKQSQNKKGEFVERIIRSTSAAQQNCSLVKEDDMAIDSETSQWFTAHDDYSD